MQGFHQFTATNHQFLANQLLGVIHTASEHLRDSEEARLVVIYDAAVGRDGHFAVRAGIEGIDGLVR